MRGWHRRSLGPVLDELRQYGTFEIQPLNWALFPESRLEPGVNDEKRVLYEQVTDVNVFPYQGLCLCCCRCVACCSPPGLYSRSDELIVDLSSVPAGVREENRCCYFSVGLKDQNAHAVIGTRYRRNK